MTVESPSFPLQYVTAEDGRRLAVLLPWQEFQRLNLSGLDDPDLLPGLSIPELEALADGMLSPERQEELNRLLDENERDALTSSEVESLDRLLEQIDVLSILKARAKLTLETRVVVSEE